MRQAQKAVAREMQALQANRGSWEGAATALRRAASLNVHASGQPLRSLAQVALKLGRPVDALLAYRDAAEVHPWSAPPLLELMQLLLRLDPKRGDHATAYANAAKQQAAAGHLPLPTAKAAAGGPSACDLHDAVTRIQPAALSSHRAARELCRRAPGAYTPPTDALSPLAASQLKHSACADVMPYPALAARIVERLADASRCVVKLGAERVGLHDGRGAAADGDPGLLVRKGVEMLIQGAGDEDSTLDAGGHSRHFIVARGGKLRLAGVRLRGGRSLLAGGGAALLLPGSHLEATDVTFEHNRAVVGSGGALAARGATLSLARAVFEANEAGWRGGGISLASVAEDREAEHGHASAQLSEVSWRGNAAGRGGDDVMLSGGADLLPLPRATEATVERSPVGSEGMASGAHGLFSAPSELMLRLNVGSMSALEMASEALSLTEVEGLEPGALALFETATAADPYSPNAFNFHFKFLYTHGLDDRASACVAAFGAAVPEHPSLPPMRAALRNESAALMLSRARTINQQIVRMREGAPTVIPQTTRAAAQDVVVEAFLRAAALTPTDGEVWEDLGTSLEFASEMTESIAAYAHGLRLAPSHAGLNQEAAKKASYPPAPTSSDALAAELRTRIDAAFDVVALPEGSFGSQPHSMDLHGGDLPRVLAMFGATPSIYVSREPLIPRATCAKYVKAAEAWARSHGGWTTSRHYSVPTTDVPLVELPKLLPSFNRALHEGLLPALAAIYPAAAPLVSKLHVLDCFLVRYDAAAQASLPTHADQSLLSFTIALNDPGEYEGGGTYFRGLDRAVDAPAAGHAVMFPGKVEHGGQPITRGRRYIIVLFMGYDANRMSGREAGYVLERFRELTPGGNSAKASRRKASRRKASRRKAAAGKGAKEEL